MDRREIRVALGGSAVVGVAFGMARYAYGLTLPDVRAEFDLSELLVALVASGTFAGYLVGLVAVPRLSARRGPRAPTTVGGVCGAVGATAVALAPTPWVLALGAVISGSAAGWVWAPYSDIVTRIAPRPDRPVLLAAITTGTSVGLAGLGALGLLGLLTSWRVTWAGIAAAAAAVTIANLRAVPRLDADRSRDEEPRSLWRRALIGPLTYAVLYFAAITAYFTYATDAARSGGLGAWSAPLLFAVIGLGGLAGLGTGAMARTVGTATVAIASVHLVGVALVLLGLGRGSLLLTLVSALLLGTGFMVGSSLLAIWTGAAVPDRPGDAFTSALVVGALVSIATPAAMGAAIPFVGLPTVLVTAALVTAVGVTSLAAPPLRRRVAPGQEARR